MVIFVAAFDVVNFYNAENFQLQFYEAEVRLAIVFYLKCCIMLVKRTSVRR